MQDRFRAGDGGSRGGLGAGQDLGEHLGRQLARADLSPRARLLITVFGVGTMLVVLGYFKYTYFILDILRELGGPAWSVGKIILPLGIMWCACLAIGFAPSCTRYEPSRYSEDSCPPPRQTH